MTSGTVLHYQAEINLKDQLGPEDIVDFFLYRGFIITITRESTNKLAEATRYFLTSLNENDQTKLERGTFSLSVEIIYINLVDVVFVEDNKRTGA